MHFINHLNPAIFNLTRQHKIERTFIQLTFEIYGLHVELSRLWKLQALIYAW